jgi:lectin, mannose-binding 2
MPAVAYLGFSAETGELADNHDIISVETRNLYAPEAGKGGATAEFGRNTAHKSMKGKDKSGGWGWFFIKFCMFGFLVVGVYAGVAAYRTQKYKSRF